VIGRKFSEESGNSKTFERAVESLLKEKAEKGVVEVEKDDFERKFGVFGVEELEGREKKEGKAVALESDCSLMDNYKEINQGELDFGDDEDDNKFTEESSINVEDKKQKKGLRVSYYDEIYKVKKIVSKKNIG
jgi:hypothetical protein